MSKVLLGDVARERRETCKGSKDGYPIVGLEHLTPEEITLSAWDEEKENTFTKLFRKGDVLFGRRRAYLKKAAVAPFDGICSGDITVIEAIPEKILPELLPFIIQNDALFDFAVGKSAGSLSPRVKWEHLKNYSFELPDMEEQRRLAKVLWAMDATKKAYQKLIQKTDELVKSQFIALFGDSNINPYHWPNTTLGAEFQISSGGTPATKNNEYWDGGTIPWIGSNMCQDAIIYTNDGKYITESGLQHSSAKQLAEGHVLVALVGATIGKTALLKFSCTTNQNIAAVDVCANNKFTSEFVFYYLQSIYRKFLELGGGQFKMANLSFVRQLPIFQPPIDLQTHFSNIVQQSDKSKFELEQALAELTATYKRIIAENLG